MAVLVGLQYTETILTVLRYVLLIYSETKIKDCTVQDLSLLY